MLTVPTFTLTPKRALARLALIELADYIVSAPRADAPLPFGRRYAVDELLETLIAPMDGSACMVDVVPDPTASDGYVDYCMVCEGDPHGANCPVGMLEALAEVGLDSDTPVPANLGLRSVIR